MLLLLPLGHISNTFEVPEPSAALFFFADSLLFFGRAAFGSFEMGACGSAGAGGGAALS